MLLFLSALALTGIQSAACEEVTRKASGKIRTALMCRNMDGTWREATEAPGQDSGVAASGLPARAEITYRGTYDVTFPEPLARGRRQGGRINFTVKLDSGTIVSASLWGEKYSRDSISGVFNERDCHLVNAQRTTFIDGTCNAAGISGRITGRGNGREFSGHIDLAAVGVVGVAAREEAANLAAAKVAEERRLAAIETAAADKARAEEERAAISRLKASLPKGAEQRYTPLLERAIQEDSQHWRFNRYQAGSIDLLAVKRDESGAIFLKASFKYAGGSSSQVGATLARGTISCLTFPDDPQGCRPIGQGIGSAMKATTGQPNTPKPDLPGCYNRAGQYLGPPILGSCDVW
ncbi:MAG: hypothetical protein J7517_06020 [Sphingobium yanoikuyae]|nr:hypothetical protein [Sphingobium yanoikuyae]